MIIATFQKTRSGSYKGFRISGHSGYSDEGSDIVCASVSSAVMLTINTAAEFYSIDLDTDVSEGEISCGISGITSDSDRLLKSLEAHLSFIQEDYPENIKVNISEV